MPGLERSRRRRNAEAVAAKALQKTAPVFAALGDETRLAIVARLSAGTPQSIAALTAGAGLTRQAVTKHLHVLGDAGLVRSLRQGRERLWELEPDKLASARRCLDNISTQWDQSLGRLKSFVESS
jgi:DNA-binding transcriptional ArsR family regulator